MTCEQAIKKYGILESRRIPEQFLSKKQEKVQPSLEDYVARAMTVIAPYIDFDISDTDLCTIQINLHKIFSDYKKSYDTSGK